MKLTHIWLVLMMVFLFGTHEAFSQERSSALKKKALIHERYGDYYGALEYYEKYLTQSPGRAYTEFHVGELYEKIRVYDKAAKHYLNAFDLKPNRYAKALFHYAYMLKMQAKYEQAIESMNKARRKLKGKRDYKQYRKRIRKEIEGCELALQQMEKPLNVILEKLDESINFDHIDYSPFPLNDSLFIYASVRINKVFRYIESQQDTDVSSSFYYARKIDGTWKGGYAVFDSFNVKGKDFGNASLCPHGDRFYFTQCYRNEENKNICAIYYSDRKKGKWQSPVSLGKAVNHPRYTSTQPSVGIESRRGREVVYFSSDRPGGRGGMDLWYSMYDQEKNEYSAPRNMGGKINTSGDEVTPFYDQENRRLYYSSNGENSIGGLDVFKTTGELRRWEEPVNIGYPVNSSADDIYYSLNPDNRSEGFLVSNRPGANVLDQITCCDDIYAFSYPDYINILLKGSVVALEDTSKVQYIENLIAESPEADIANGKPMEKVLVRLFKVSDNERFLLSTDTTNSEGQYQFRIEAENDYKIVVEKEGYFSRQRSLSTTAVTTSDTFIRDLYLIKIPEKPLVIRNIYYPFDKSYLTDSAKATIDTTILILLQDNPQIIAEISSHTDSKGSDTYNERLSQRRAQSVVNYLIDNGIKKERLQAKGYGETQPIAPNENPDGSDNPEGRQKNRRTEFRVVGLLPEYSEVIYEE
jgi:OOP family OmpA-OmpF porin